MAHDVFISYSHIDNTIANAIVAGLEGEGIRCWIAPRDATPGQTWSEDIVNAIAGAKIMVMILSDNSNRSRQVLREVERATANEVIIIPFRIENIDPTGAMAYFLSTEHWLDALNPPLEDHIRKLTRTIKTFLSGDPLPEKPFTPSPRSSYPKPKRNNTLPFIIGAVSIILISIIGYFIFKGLNPADDPTTSNPKDSPITQTEENFITNTEVVLETTSTLAPTFEMIGEYRTSHAAEGLFIEDNTLYLANSADDLMRMNISNPANPMPLDVYSAYGAQEVVAENGVLYVILGEDIRELLVIDFNNDTTYTYTSQDSDIPWSFYHLAVQNGLLHIAGHNYWGIIDLSEPGNAQELWQWEPATNSGVTCSFVFRDNIAYIGAGWEGLHIFDITDPNSPVEIGGFDTPNWIVGMSLAEDTLYLSLGESGLLALDVTDPSRPLMMSTLDLPGNITESSASEDTLYVLYSELESYEVVESGVVAVDISDPADLKIITTYTELHEAADIQVWEGAVFITDRPWGLVVLALDVE